MNKIERVIKKEVVENEIEHHFKGAPQHRWGMNPAIDLDPGGAPFITCTSLRECTKGVSN